MLAKQYRRHKVVVRQACIERHEKILDRGAKPTCLLELLVVGEHPVCRATDSLPAIWEALLHLILGLGVIIFYVFFFLPQSPVPQHGHVGVWVDAEPQNVLAQIFALFEVVISKV